MIRACYLYLFGVLFQMQDVPFESVASPQNYKQFVFTSGAPPLFHKGSNASCAKERAPVDDCGMSTIPI